VLSLSLYWTLQSLVYLKLRRVVDGTPEDEVWDGPLGKEPPRVGGQPQPEGKTVGAAEPVSPKRAQISFADTVGGGEALRRLFLLFPGVFWAALVLAAGGLAARQLAGPPQQPLTVAGIGEAVRELASGNLLVLLAVAAGVVLAGAVGLGRPVQAGARSAAVQTVYGRPLPRREARSFGRRTRRGRGAAVLLAAGTQLLLATLALTGSSLQGDETWPEVLLLGGLGLTLLGVGALTLAPLAVDNPPAGEEAAGGMTAYVDNGPETLASATLSLVRGACGWLEVAGIAWLVWLLLSESLSWWGGGQAGWVRWGLDGRLVPESGPGLSRVACGIAGFWFSWVAVLVLTYPLSYVLGWGVTCYLRARQQGRQVPADQINLSEEERQALQAAQEARTKFRADLKSKALKLKDSAPAEGTPRAAGRATD
jgi:hypothetical protein